MQWKRNLHMWKMNCEHYQVSSNVSTPASNLYKAICNKIVYYIDQTSECFSDPRIVKVFFIIFIVTFLLGLLTVLITRQIILQCSNKDMSSSDYRVSTTKKDKTVLHNVYARTVTYTREKPEDINININKLRVHDTLKYKF
ncbi:hypothetical protein FKM82_006930 [Ascaphus truei]